MGISLADYDRLAREAISFFWASRSLAQRRQKERGIVDQGSRSAVTAGKNMDGFRKLIRAVVTENGLPEADLQFNKKMVTLPAYFRPTKQWDVLVVHEGKLIATLELKSQVGSFGKNFNNRAEEAIGNATDFWTAYREGAFHTSPRPFLGYLMVIEDCEASRSVVKADSPHFPLFSEFENTSYAARYEILCRKLVQEGLYDAAALLLTSRRHAESGRYSELGVSTGLKTWVTGLASRVAAAAAMVSR